MYIIYFNLSHIRGPKIRKVMFQKNKDWRTATALIILGDKSD